jgi:hypothetical protein
MSTHQQQLIFVCIVACAIACAAFPAFAGDDSSDAEREAAQRALNQQVLSRPFDAGDVDKARVYSEEAKKSNVAPVAQPPAYWVPGWTCANLTAYAYYNYMDYRNCVYYNYYYGRYWR